MGYPGSDGNGGSQEYECQNAGCESDSVFEAAPESWFDDRGLDLPRNCEDCKDWIEEQKEIGPVVAVCKYCKHRHTIEASYRIMYHKNDGNWDVYWENGGKNAMCYRCEEDPLRRRGLREWRAQKRYERGEVDPEEELKEQEALQWFKDNPTPVPVFHVPVQAKFYESVKNTGHRAVKHGENQLQHIMKLGHKWQERLSLSDPEDIPRVLSKIAQSNNPAIRTYKSGFCIVKYDLDTGIAVLIKGEPSSPTENGIETGYCARARDVQRKVADGKWKPL